VIGSAQTVLQRRGLPLWLALIVAAASGPVIDAGFPDRGWWPLTFVGIGLVLWSLIGRRPRAALLVGFVSGLAFYFIHIEWASLFLGPLPMSALSILESMFVAVGAMLIAIAYRWVPVVLPGAVGRMLVLPVVVAGIWVSREAISAVWPYGGFSWGRVSESQSQSPFAHLFPWLGISGVGFVMVALVAMAVEVIRMPRQPTAGAASGLRRTHIVRPVIAVLVIALFAVVPAFPIVAKGSTVVAAVQGDGPAGYFDKHSYGDLLAAQYNATQPLFGRHVDVVIWPEGASDIDPLESAQAANTFNTVSREMHAPLIAGAITHRGSKYYNTSLLWEDGKGAVDYYDKKHPVPFGEYVPDRAFWRPFAPSLIDLIQREYTPGTTDTVFNVNGVIAGINICFDITDDTVMRDSISSGAEILIAQTNNADFGHTDESVQQLAIARIRAMELGRTLVNNSTVGTSAIIAPDGSTIDQSKTFVAATMVDRVPLSSTITPASVFGQWIEWIVSALGVGGMLAAVIIGKRRRRRLALGEESDG
jgi:apolipoprotein N-acyltransferase